MNKKYLLITLVLTLILVGAGCNKKIYQPAIVNVDQAAVVAPSSSDFLAITSPSSTITEKDLKEEILYSGQKALMARNSTEGLFVFQINPKLPPYTFHIFASTDSRVGSIEISKSSDSGKQQIIDLDPNAFRAQDAPLTFGINDINFDGFLDIGVIVDGGAKWAMFQYWTFDVKTGQFIISPIAKEFREIGFNEIKFDSKNKRIITNNFVGPEITSKQVYTVAGGHLKLIEEYHQEQDYQNDQVIKQCTVTTKKYTGNKVQSSTEILDDTCTGYYGKL